MTNLVDRPNSDRGDRRRAQLVDAGVAQLCDGGWPAVTTRGVAERAGANVGLIHYHFGGLAGLHVAVARRAGEMVINPVVAALLDAADERSALATLPRLLPATTGDEQTMRLAVELIAGAVRDTALGEVLRQQLQQARTELADWIERLHPDWPQERRVGASTLVAALLDGLMLHHTLDPELPTEAAVDTLGELIEGTGKGRRS